MQILFAKLKLRMAEPGRRALSDGSIALGYRGVMSGALALGILVGNDASSINTWDLGSLRCQYQ
jgi:hypothetical protein